MAYTNIIDFISHLIPGVPRYYDVVRSLPSILRIRIVLCTIFPYLLSFLADKFKFPRRSFDPYKVNHSTWNYIKFIDQYFTVQLDGGTLSQLDNKIYSYHMYFIIFLSPFERDWRSGVKLSNPVSLRLLSLIHASTVLSQNSELVKRHAGVVLTTTIDDSQ